MRPQTEIGTGLADDSSEHASVMGLASWSG